MNEDPAILAQYDQWIATQRDVAEGYKTIHDQFIRAGFSPNHAFELMLRQLDVMSGWCDEAD